MSTVFRYRLWCSTEEAHVYVWASEDDPVPTTCPNDTDHTIDASKTAITEKVSENDVHVRPNYGDDDTVIGGVSVAFVADQWVRKDYGLVESLHIQNVHVTVKGWRAGDYGRLSVVHPVNQYGYSSPTSAVDAGATAIPVPADFAAVATQAVAVEFWSDDDSDLREIRGIASSNGTDTVTLAEAVAYAHTTSARMRLVMACFHQQGGGGSDHIDDGFTSVGDSHIPIGSQNEATNPVQAGLLLAHRFKGSSLVSDREVAVTYRFRRPSS